MSYRIAFGPMNCEIINPHDKIGQKIKEIIENKINLFKATDFNLLINFSEYSYLDYKVENKLVEVSFFREILDSENVLLVVRASYRSINLPNYICWGFIGRVYAEGLIVNSKNESKKPDETLLWQFK